jgi:hypothetical protein
MARRGGRQHDPLREKFWRRTIRQQQRSGLSVRAFCLREGLKEGAFRWWRQALARRDREMAAATQADQDGDLSQGFFARFLTLLDRALDQVGREFPRRRKGVLYDRLKVVLTGAEGAACYARLGVELGMTEDAVKKAAQRLRQRYREVLRELVAETVGEPGQVDDEIRALFAILAS